MKVIIYSKEGCQYCDHAVTLSEAEGLESRKDFDRKGGTKKIMWWQYRFLPSNIY